MRFARWNVGTWMLHARMENTVDLAIRVKFARTMLTKQNIFHSNLDFAIEVNRVYVWRCCCYTDCTAAGCRSVSMVRWCVRDTSSTSKFSLKPILSNLLPCISPILSSSLSSCHTAFTARHTHTFWMSKLSTKVYLPWHGIGIRCFGHKNSQLREWRGRQKQDEEKSRNCQWIGETKRNEINKIIRFAAVYVCRPFTHSFRWWW